MVWWFHKTHTHPRQMHQGAEHQSAPHRQVQLHSAHWVSYLRHSSGQVESLNGDRPAITEAQLSSPGLAVWQERCTAGYTHFRGKHRLQLSQRKNDTIARKGRAAFITGQPIWRASPASPILTGPEQLDLYDTVAPELFIAVMRQTAVSVKAEAAS